MAQHGRADLHGRGRHHGQERHALGDQRQRRRHQPDAKLDSALYKQPDNGPASSGIWGKITGGASKALEAVKAFTDTAGAMAAWAGIKYSTSINVGSNARLVSNSDISVKASNTVKVELSPLVAKIAGIAVGVLESYSRVTIDGRLVAAKSITVGRQRPVADHLADAGPDRRRAGRDRWA